MAPEPPPPSARVRIVSGIAPDRLVTGLRPDGGWVTASGSPDEPVIPLPHLDGVLLTEDAAEPASATDFGGLVKQSSSARLRPGSVEDVARFLGFATANGIRVAARGQGHSVFGQSQVQGGVQIDMRLCDRILGVEDRTVEVEAGATWRSVLQVTLSHGLTPPVTPDYLGLTVGGTLSVGGVNGASWRFGAQVDNVEALTVATGAGDVIRCSGSSNPGLFNAVLAGQGQCGVILSAQIGLIVAPSSVRVFDLGYPAVEPAIADLRVVVEEERFDFAQILVAPGPGGWVFILEGVCWKGNDDRDDDSLLSGLRFVRETLEVMDQPYFEFADRVVSQMGDIAAVGLGDFPHPWVDLFVPGSQAEAFIGRVIGELTPAGLGRSFPLLVYPFRRAPMGRPLLRVPKEDFFVLFDILRTASPGAAGQDEMLADNHRLFDENRLLGGTHYPISALGLTPSDWERHFGDAWEDLRDAKRRYDPAGILTPGPGIFPL